MSLAILGLGIVLAGLVGYITDRVLSHLMPHRSSAIRWVSLTFTLLTLLVIAVAPSLTRLLPQSASATAVPHPVGSSATATPGETLAARQLVPVRLSIPAISLDQKVVDVGLDKMRGERIPLCGY